MVLVMLVLTKKIGGKSGKYFIVQQNDLSTVNGYIEEMLSGQKVIKVFCHEQQTKDGFDVLNEKLCESATGANKYANIMMPIMGNLGNLHYVLTALIGSLLAITGIAPLTLGTIATFLQMTRSFNQPFSQISQQFNSIVMALAGAERIFRLIDEEPEKDDGYVTLVNAAFDHDGNLYECKERTGTWAWKHPHHDGTLTYTQLKGDVRFYDMSFGYDENKMVLHDLTLYAKPGQKIAFVGSTGAGKTTITNLINRFYDVQDGKIRYDGININKIKKQTCAEASASFCRILTCLPELSWKISVMVIWMQPTKRFMRLQNWQMLTSLSDVFQMATTPLSPEMAENFHKVSASCFPSQELLLPILRYSFWTKLLPALIPVPKQSFSAVWMH